MRVFGLATLNGISDLEGRVPDHSIEFFSAVSSRDLVYTFVLVSRLDVMCLSCIEYMFLYSLYVSIMCRFVLFER